MQKTQNFMSKEIKPHLIDSAEWNAAVAAVGRLAGTRRVLRDLHDEAAGEPVSVPNSPAAPAIDDDELEQARREIEKAAAALQVVQPELTAQSSILNSIPPQRSLWPVWLLIGFIWTGMVAVIITAIQAVKTLM